MDLGRKEGDQMANLKAILKIMQQNLVPVASYEVLCMCCKGVIGKTYLKSQSRRLCKACQAVQQASSSQLALKSVIPPSSGGEEGGGGQQAA
jgi:hypothetical protein